MPIDVEIGCESRAGPIFEHIHPPLIERLGDPDVIRHEIEHLAHRVRMQFRNPRVVRFAGTDRRVEFVMIRNVVTVETLGARLKIRRCVSITHTERVQIGNNLARLRESEPAVELQPIGASRNARMVLLCHFVRHSKRSRGTLLLSPSRKPENDERCLNSARHDKSLHLLWHLDAKQIETALQNAPAKIA